MAVTRCVHAVAVSTATCHLPLLSAPAAWPTNNVSAATATYPPTALPTIPTSAARAQRNNRLNTAHPLATSLMKSPYQLCEASIRSMHSSLSTLASSVQCLATTSDSTGTFAKHPICLPLSVYRSRIMIFDIFESFSDEKRLRSY